MFRRGVDLVIDHMFDDVTKVLTGLFDAQISNHKEKRIKFDFLAMVCGLHPNGVQGSSP
jgi:hypothetical protein